ncbi:choice-of-anchor D domain-containing protein [Conexibacter sp. W3-3-2]|nr:choice-of-anchor D domain-containing protein [Conexibacter sp. W3-3-2]
MSGTPPGRTRRLVGVPGTGGGVGPTRGRGLMRRSIASSIGVLLLALGGLTAAPASAAPALTAAPATLDFGSVSTTSYLVSRTTTLTNTGDAPYAIASITIPDAGTTGFQLGGGTCSAGTSVPVGSSCTVTALLRPQATGPLQATLRVTGTGAPTRDVPLAATGTPAELAVDPAGSVGLDAGNVLVSGTSAPLTLTFSAVGERDLTGVRFVSASTRVRRLAGVDGGTCGATLPRGASCTVVVVFEPTQEGGVGVGLDLLAAEGSVGTSLRGAGVLDRRIAVDDIDLGEWSIVRGASAVRTVTVRSTGTLPLTLDGIDVTSTAIGEFTRAPGADAGTCTTAVEIPPGGSCTVGVRFDPGAVGARSGAVRVRSNAGNVTPFRNGNAIGALTGTGIEPAATLTPSPLAFGGQPVTAGASPTRTVTLTSSGTTRLELTALAVVGARAAEYPLAGGTCTATTTLDPGASCTVAIAFDPAATGSRTATLELLGNVGRSTVALTGTGTAPLLEAGPARLDLGARAVGSGPSAGEDVTIANRGDAPLEVTALELSPAGAPYVLDPGSCRSGPVAAGGSCRVTVAFAPVAVGDAPATLVVRTADAAAAVQLTGRGTAPAPAPVEPTPTATPTPTPDPPAPTAPAGDAPAPAAPAAVVPVAPQATAPLLPTIRRCVSRRSFVLRILRTAGRTPRSIEVRYAGRVLRRSGRSLRSRIDLRGLPKGRFTVRIVVRFTDGTTLRDSRQYRTCTPKRSGGRA